MAVPVWHPGLTKQQAKDIEAIQKISFKIILKHNYTNYELACKKFNTITLEERRIKLCYRFARKNLKSDHSYFTQISSNIKTRSNSLIRVKEVKCNFVRFSKSSIPYLARLLNTYRN